MHGSELELDEMIEQEKRQVALEFVREAWDGGRLEGIEMEIMAEAAIADGLRKLAATASEDALLDYLETLKQQIVAGAFQVRTLQ